MKNRSLQNADELLETAENIRRPDKAVSPTFFNMQYRDKPVRKVFEELPDMSGWVIRFGLSWTGEK